VEGKANQAAMQKPKQAIPVSQGDTLVSFPHAPIQQISAENLRVLKS